MPIFGTRVPMSPEPLDPGRHGSQDDVVSPVLRSSLSTVAVGAASLLLGGLTSWAQGFLPDALAPFANSPSGWTALTVLLVAMVRPSPLMGAVLGVVSFVGLVLGYTVASELRGLTYSPVLWGAVGVLAGPFVGAAAAALVGRRALLAGVGAGALGGVLVADGIYGLTVVGETTSPVYWTACLALGVVLVAVTGARLRERRAVVALVLTAVAATLVLSAGYAVLNAI